MGLIKNNNNTIIIDFNNVTTYDIFKLTDTYNKTIGPPKVKNLYENTWEINIRQGHLENAVIVPDKLILKKSRLYIKWIKNYYFTNETLSTFNISDHLRQFAEDIKSIPCGFQDRVSNIAKWKINNIIENYNISRNKYNKFDSILGFLALVQKFYYESEDFVISNDTWVNFMKLINFCDNKLSLIKIEYDPILNSISEKKSNGFYNIEFLNNTMLSVSNLRTYSEFHEFQLINTFQRYLNRN